MALNLVFLLTLSALLLGSAHAALRRGMSIRVFNRTPFPLRFVEAAKDKTKTNGDWRIHFVNPNGDALLANKDVRHVDRSLVAHHTHTHREATWTTATSIFSCSGSARAFRT